MGLVYGSVTLGLPMDREKMLTVPGHTAAMEVQRVYTQGSYLTVDLSGLSACV